MKSEAITSPFLYLRITSQIYLDHYKDRHANNLKPHDIPKWLKISVHIMCI